MRLTQPLRSQHIGQWFKYLWHKRKNYTVYDMKSDVVLREKGVQVEDAFKMVYPKLPNHIKEYTIKPAIQLPSQEVEVVDETHPLWNSRKRHIFGDTNVLIMGMPQAQVLLKTVCVDGLPQTLQKSIDAIELKRETEKNMKNAILNAHLFDTQQEKLERLKDPLRPAWVYPRVYGITRKRKNELLVAKILRECEKQADTSLSRQRRIVTDALNVVPFEKDDKCFQFEFTAETFLASKTPLPAIAESSSHVSQELPDIYPLAYSISMPAGHLYKLRNIYPIRPSSGYTHPHTIFLDYTQKVQNLNATPVTQSQFESRAMLKAFAVAAASAQSRYGADVKQLPEPITLQCVQIDGNKFYFGVYQLNTLELDGTDGLKNLWFSVPMKEFYESCDYDEARPHLVNYNGDVLRHAIAFYNNQ